jgi:hypothetical protein
MLSSSLVLRFLGAGFLDSWDEPFTPGSASSEMDFRFDKTFSLVSAFSSLCVVFVVTALPLVVAELAKGSWPLDLRGDCRTIVQ